MARPPTSTMAPARTIPYEKDLFISILFSRRGGVSNVGRESARSQLGSPGGDACWFQGAPRPGAEGCLRSAPASGRVSYRAYLRSVRPPEIGLRARRRRVAPR